MVIGIDIDGTLDTFGDFFEVSIPAWQKAGIKVGIITARLESDKQSVADVLKKVGIKMDFLMFKPLEFQNAQLPDGVWKGVLCRLLEVDILFDDMERNDPTFVADITQILNGTQILTPVEYGKQLDGHDETTNEYAEQMINALGGKAKEEKK